MTEAISLAISNEWLSAADVFHATTDQARLNPADLQRHWLRQRSCDRQSRQRPSRPFRECANRQQANIPGRAGPGLLVRARALRQQDHER